MRKLTRRGLAAWFLVLVQERKKIKAAPTNDKEVTVTAICTFYGRESHGNLMADGSRFDMSDPSIVAVGDRDIPLGTQMIIHNMETSRKLPVVVRDRMNARYHGLGTLRLDLSRAGAEALGIVERGRVYLTVEFVPPPKWLTRHEEHAN